MLPVNSYRVWHGEVFRVADPETIYFLESGVSVKGQSAMDYWVQSAKASVGDIQRSSRRAGTKRFIGG